MRSLSFSILFLIFSCTKLPSGETYSSRVNHYLCKTLKIHSFCINAYNVYYPNKQFQKIIDMVKDCSSINEKACVMLAQAYTIEAEFMKAYQVAQNACVPNGTFSCKYLKFLKHILDFEKSCFEINNFENSCRELFKNTILHNTPEFIESYFDQHCNPESKVICDVAARYYEYKEKKGINSKKTLKFYQKGCELEHPASCEGLAYTFRKKSEPEDFKAIQAYEKALKIDPHNNIAANDLAWFYNNPEREIYNPQKSIQVCEQYLLSGNEKQIHSSNYGTCSAGYSNLKNFKKAIKLIKKGHSLIEKEYAKEKNRRIKKEKLFNIVLEAYENKKTHSESGFYKDDFWDY